MPKVPVHLQGITNRQHAVSSLKSKKPLLTVSEAASYLGVAAITLRRWDRDGILPSDRTKGGQRRYRVSTLDAFRQGETTQPQKLHHDGIHPRGVTASGAHPGGGISEIPGVTLVIQGTRAAQVIEKLSIGTKGFKNLLTISKYSVPIKCAAVLVSALVLWQSSHAFPQRPAPVPREQTRIVQGHTEKAVSSRGSESDRGEVAGAKSNLVPTRTRNLSDTITQQVSKLSSSFVEWYLPKQDSDPVTSAMWILLASSLVGLVTFVVLYPTFLGLRLLVSKKNFIIKLYQNLFSLPLATMIKQGHPLKARPLSPVGPSFHRAINLILTLLVISTLVVAGTSQLRERETKVRAAAGVPKILTYQGRLLDSNGTPISGGSLKMVFRIYTASSGGTASWTETRDGASGNPGKVSTSSTTGREGEFSVLLGDTSNSGTALTIDFNQDTYYLGIQVEDNSEMTPRVRITAAPYALNADSVDGINAALTATASTLYPLNADAKFPTSVLYSSNGANPSVSDYSLNTYVLSLDGSGNITASGNFRINTNAGTIILRAASGNITLGDGTNTITNSDASTSLTLNSRKNINFFTERAGNIDSSGNLGILGYFITGSFAGVPASTASRNGEIIFDSTSNNIMAYNGGGWVGLGGSPALLTDGGAITYLISTSDDVSLSGTTDSANFFLDHDKELRLQSINLNVNGSVNIAQSLNVRGVTQLGTVKTPTTTLDIFGSGNIDTNFNVLGNTRLGQGSTVTGTLPLDVFGSLNISGSANIRDRLMVGATSGQVAATVPLDVLGSFNVSGAANILGQCVTGDSVLTMADGSTMRIDQVKGGEYVSSLDEQTGRIVPAKIKGLLDMGVKPVFKLTTEDGRTIRTTGNHPYLAQSETALPTPRGLSPESNKHEQKGNYQERGSDLSTIDSIQEIHDSTTSSIFADSTKHSVPKSKLLINTQDSSDGLTKPGAMNAAPNQPADRLTKSAENDLSQGLEKRSSTVPTIGGNNAFVNEHAASWTKVMHLRSGVRIAVQNEGTVVWVAIKHIEYVGEEQVYDIEVEGTHNFVANGLIAHNTYLAGPVAISSTLRSPTVPLDVLGSVNISGSLNVIGVGSPNLIGSVGTGTSPQGIAVQGRYAYVSSNISNMLQVFDSSNTSSFNVIGSVGTGTGPLALAVSGRYAYVAANVTNILQVIDISNPGSMNVVSSVGTGSAPRGIAIQGRYAYVTAQTGNVVQIFDISNPSSINVVSSVGTRSQPMEIALQGRYAYVSVNGADMMEVYDISNPTSVNIVNSVVTGDQPLGIAIQGRYTYVISTGSNLLQVIDSALPASSNSVNVLSSVGTHTSPRHITVQGRYAYLVNNTTATIQIVDVSNPTSINIVGSVGTGSAPVEIAVSGRYAYVTASTGNILQVFDLGGTYLAQLEAGGIEAGSLQVRGPLIAYTDTDIKGGLTIGRGLSVTGPFSVNAGGVSSPFGVDYLGNIGMGTAYPTLKLDVGGTGSVNIAGSLNVLGSTQLGTRKLATTTLDLLGSLNVSGSANIRGSVMIGATALAVAPTVPLDVLGSVNMNSLNIWLTGSTDSLNVSPRQAGASANFLFVNGGAACTGCVGIGTTGPTEPLTVGDNGVTAGKADVLIDGTFANVAYTTHGRLMFNDANFGIGAGGFAATGNDDDLYLWAYDGAGRDIRFMETTDGNTDPNSGTWTTNMIIKNGGNVGIGTTAPSTLLDIAAAGALNVAGAANILGSVQIGTRKAATVPLDILGSVNIGGSLNLQASGGSKAELRMATDNAFASLNILVPTSANIIIPNGYVGIGTARPGSIFSVNHATDPRMEFTSGNGLTYLTKFTGTWSGLTNPFILQSDSSGDMTITPVLNTPTSGIVIKQGGNIGIGTTAPATLLDIAAAGALNVAGAANILGSVQIGTRKAATVPLDVLGSVNMNSLNIWLSATTDSLNVSPRQAGASGNFLFVNGSTNCTGCVGIGTANPGVKLHVDETAAGGIIARFGENDSTGRWQFQNAGNPVTRRSLEGYGGTALTIVLQPAGSTFFNGGNVGIGNSSPSSNLDISGNVEIDAPSTANTTALCWDNAGHSLIYDCNGSATDLAENYGTDDVSIEAGDVVMIDPKKDAVSIPDPHEGKPTTKAYITKSENAYDTRVIGVISTNPTQVYGDDIFDPFENPRPVSLAGRVPVKVSTENGEIKTGDYLTSSSIPGIAMKATRPGEVIGKALGGFNGTNGEICPSGLPSTSGTIAQGGVRNQEQHQESNSTNNIERFKGANNNVHTPSSLNSTMLTNTESTVNTNPDNIEKAETVAPVNTGNTSEAKNTTPTLPNISESLSSWSSLSSGTVNPTPPLCGKVITFVNVSFADPSTVLAQLSFDHSGNIVNTMKSINTSSPYVSVEQVRVVSDNTTPEVSSSVSLLTQLKDAVEGILGKQTDLEKRLKVLEECNSSTSTKLGADEEQKTTLSGGSLKASGEIITSPSTSFMGSRMIRDSDLSSNNSLSDDITNVNSHESGDAGNRTPGTRLDRSVPDQPTPTPLTLCDTGIALVKDEDIDSLSLNTQTVKDVLTVLGRTSLGTTSIAGLFTQDGTLTIDKGNEISVLGTPEAHPGGVTSPDGILYLQRSPFSKGLDILAGKMMIDREGNVQIAGDIHVGGSIEASQFALSHNTDTSGIAFIPAFEYGTIVETTAASTNALVLITPTVVIDHPLAVTEILPGAGFIVEIASPLSTNSTFNWWIVPRKNSD